MHRLMIVDDERHVVDWLYELFLEKSGLELDILKAYSGKEAMNILDATKIDVILSDIRMPGMSGLELQEKVRVNWPGCRMIFLTGFNEFDYIYKAVKQEGVSYLLKTEDDEQIVEAVKQAVLSIEKELKHEELLSRALDLDRLATFLLQREALLELINGPVADRRMLDSLGATLDAGRPVLLLLGVENGEASRSGLLDRSRKLLLLDDLTRQYFLRGISHAVVDIDRNLILWILQPGVDFCGATVGSEPGMDWKKAAAYVREMLETFQVACTKSLNLCLSFAFCADPVPWETLGVKFDALKFTADSRNRNADAAYPSIRMVSTEELSGAAERIWDTGYPWAKKTGMLRDCLEQGMRKEFLELLDEMSGSMGDMPVRRHLPSLERLYALSLIFLHHINRFDLANEFASSSALSRLTQVEGFATSGEAFSFLKELGNSIFELGRQDAANREAEIAGRIKSFVRSNIGSELTLVRISESVNYNPSYVSRLFKQATGTNLFDYIINVRISRAKELLEDNSASIQGVAHAVGFDSSQYFATAFKKITGMTPNEYRNRQ